MGLFGSLFGQQNPLGHMMNLGQPPQPQNPWEMAMQPTQEQVAQQYQQQYQTPGIGDGLPGARKIGDMHAPRLPFDPRVGEVIKPGFFENGGMGSKIGVGILGGLADGLAQWGGAPPGYRNAMQQKREEDQFRQKLEAERQMRLDVMQNRVQQPTNAGRMALEAGLQSGSPQYQEFVRRYAFKPTILQIPNAQGGTDYTEYDQSGMDNGGGVPTVSDEASYNAIPPGSQYRDPNGNLRIKQ